MGECYYHFRANFESKAQASKALKDFTAFLKKNQEEVRDSYDSYTGHYKGNKDLQDYGEGVPKLSFNKKEIFFSSEVGHMGSWDNLMNFFQKKYNPIRCGWASEEDFEADYVPLYKWDEIVKEVLDKRKETLPLLLGVHPDLDELIAYKLKEKPCRQPKKS